MSNAYKKRYLLELTNQYLRQNSTQSTPSNNINEFGIQMINEKLRSYLFGTRFSQPDQQAIARAKEHLTKFELLGKEVELLKQPDDLKLPKLMGKNIDEHFNLLGIAQSKRYLKCLASLAGSSLPKLPVEFKFSPGWTR